MSVIAYHFWSPTCGPCKKIKPALNDLKDEYPTIPWVSVNTHEDPEGLAKKFQVKFVPTIVLLTINENGSPVSNERHTGSDMMGYYRMFKKVTQPSS
jgi:thiol-disulfide isomerase/thioredoxin